MRTKSSLRASQIYIEVVMCWGHLMVAERLRAVATAAWQQQYLNHYEGHYNLFKGICLNITNLFEG